jgi:hypothetical protein
MTKPTKQQLALVDAIAHAIADYHGERPGNLTCYLDAANIACLHFGWGKQGLTADMLLTARDDDDDGDAWSYRRANPPSSEVAKIASTSHDDFERQFEENFGNMDEWGKA